MFDSQIFVEANILFHIHRSREVLPILRNHVFEYEQILIKKGYKLLQLQSRRQLLHWS